MKDITQTPNKVQLQLGESLSTLIRWRFFTYFHDRKDAEERFRYDIDNFSSQNKAGKGCDILIKFWNGLWSFKDIPSCAAIFEELRTK